MKLSHPDLYNVVWSIQDENLDSGCETWGRDRLRKLSELFTSSFANVDLVKKMIEGKSVADVSCGTGRMSGACLECGARVVFGVDISKE